MERILSFAAEEDLLPREGLILCALSGGGDSTALVHFLKANGYRVAAAHFNHRLRFSADEDEALARQLCEALDVPFYRGEGDVAALPGNTEANARALRYRFLFETAEAIGAVRIATAHTADDNLETILLHLTRGCGLRGLTGIEPRRGKLVRPMLHTTRRAVEAYLAEHELPYATDETNFDESYARNRIRHRVTPVLESLNPRVAEAVARTADRLRAEAAGRHWEPPQPPPAEVSFSPVTFRAGERVATPLWVLESEMVEAAPDTPPKPDLFYLSQTVCGGELTLRPRETGDFIHPPFRAGKTVKKWHIELGVPRHERPACPVLTGGGQVLAGAAIGPQGAFLARPGERAVRFQWTRVE